MDKQKGRGWFIFWCTAPAFLLFIIFMVIPTFNIFRVSLYKWGARTGQGTFIGFKNFQDLFQDPNFPQAFQNTVLLIVVVSVVTITLALSYAAILTRTRLKGQNFFRIVFYIPNILSIVIIAAVFSEIYAPNNGLLNAILSLFKGEDVQVLWLGQGLVIYSLAGAMIWQAIGYYMVMYMAAMSAIPESLYESAGLEGAGAVTQFFHITLPLIWTNLRTTLTFFIISSVNMSFMFVTTMTDGGPDGASEVFLSFMYKQAHTNGNYGYGMAVGVVIFLFSFGLSGLVNLVTRREILEV